MYADDTQLYVVFDLSNENSFLHEMEKLKNKLKLDEYKTKVIIFKTPCSRQDICVDDVSLSDFSK